MENQELEGRKLVFLFYSSVTLDEASSFLWETPSLTADTSVSM